MNNRWQRSFARCRPGKLTALPQPIALDEPTAVARSGEPGPAAPRTPAWRRLHLRALLAHLILSLFFTWPLVLNFLPGSGTLVPGTMLEDRDQNLWNLWWVHNALLRGHNPFVTDMLYYPTPVSLYYHTLNIFNGLIAFPLLSVFSLTTVFNIIVLFSFVMGGYGAYLLVRYLCGNRWAALVGSVVFAYSAYHIATMRSLLQLVSLEWVPFFVYFLLRAACEVSWETRRDFGRWLWSRALPTGVALFLVSLVDWYYTMYALMLAGFLLLYLLLLSIRTGREPLWRRAGEPLARVGICLAIYFLLVSPILIPMYRELRATTYMTPAPDAALSNSADLLTFFQPTRDQKLWGPLFKNRREWTYGSNRYEVYAGYTVLFLVGIGLFATRNSRPVVSDIEQRVEDNTLPTDTGRVSTTLSPFFPASARIAAAATEDKEPGTAPGALPAISDVSMWPSLPTRWFWASCAAIFFALALGPVLQINGNQVRGLPMPYGLVERIPILNISRSPDRFDMPLTLCLGVLAGYGVNVLLRKWGQRLPFARRGAFLAVGGIALIALELAPIPYPQRLADIAPWYHDLGNEPGDFAILDLPPQDDYWHGAFRMYNQTAHGKRIFGGYISREFDHPFLRGTPGFQELTYVDGAGDIFAVGTDQWLSAFARYNTRYIALQKYPLPNYPDSKVDVSPSRNAIHRVLGSTVVPTYSDNELEVYKVPAPQKRVAFMTIGTGWEPRELGEDGKTHRWMGREAALQIDAPVAGQAYLTFRSSSLGSPRQLQIYHGDHLVFDQKIEPALQTYKTSGPLGIPAGISTLRFVSPEGTISPTALGMGDDPRQLSFTFLDVGLEPVAAVK